MIRRPPRSTRTDPLFPSTDALPIYAENAPRFGDRQTCEEQYGVEQCVPRNNGSFFTPLLTGFIIGQALNNFGGGYRGAPMYRDRDGNYYGGAGRPITRSEEHTSELQSLMRISYAVFCLKKKNILHSLSFFISSIFIFYYLYL